MMDYGRTEGETAGISPTTGTMDMDSSWALGPPSKVRAPGAPLCKNHLIRKRIAPAINAVAVIMATHAAERE